MAVTFVKRTEPAKTTSTPLGDLSLSVHPVFGDGSCLYHAVAHQAGLIPQASRGERAASTRLRQLVRTVMDRHPQIRQEDGMSEASWEEKKEIVTRPASWGGDVELRLMAVGLKRDILLLCLERGSVTTARLFPRTPPPLRMRGGVFHPVPLSEVRHHLHHFVIIYNGHQHYDSTKKK